MSIRTDFHLHSDLSGDSQTPMEDMIRRGIDLGLKTMCFTEHMDTGTIVESVSFVVDTPAYREKFLRMKEKYLGKIELLFGVELGIEPRYQDFLKTYARSYPFDFIIGSSHIVDGMDPYYPVFYEGRSEEQAYRRYFESVAEDLDVFSDVDVYGHLDYVVRYGPNKNKEYSYKKYRDIIDAALKKMIEKGVGLEVNSAGYKHGLGVPNPCPDIIRAYRDMGGEIVSIGSDAHSPEWIAYGFERVKEVLLACGFRYYAVFRERKPVFLKIE